MAARNRCTDSRDERIRRAGTQQIIAAESGVTNTVDRAGGSETIEALTDSIERGAIEYLDRIEGDGWQVCGHQAGYIQNEIQNAAFAYQGQWKAASRSWSGFRIEGETPIPPFQLNPELEKVRASRDRAAVAGKLKRSNKPLAAQATCCHSFWMRPRIMRRSARSPIG